MSLELVRENIDFVDDQILILLEERFRLVNEVIEIKNNNNIPIQNSKRENFIYNKISEEHNNYNLYFQNIYKEIINQSKKFQNNIISNNNLIKNNNNNLIKNNNNNLIKNNNNNLIKNNKRRCAWL